MECGLCQATHAGHRSAQMQNLPDDNLSAPNANHPREREPTVLSKKTIYIHIVFHKSFLAFALSVSLLTDGCNNLGFYILKSEDCLPIKETGILSALLTTASRAGQRAWHRGSAQ